MTETGNMFVEREESLVDLWLFIVVNTTILALLINILSLHYGNNPVAAHLLYIPVIIAAYWYPNKGLLFSCLVSAMYLGLVWFFSGGVMDDITAAFIICIVIIGVAAVTSSLSSHMRKNELKYRGIFNYSEAGVGLVNLSSLSIKEVNQRFASLLGYDRDELPSISFADLWIEPAHKEAFFIALKSHGNIENLETRFHSRVKGDRWVLVSAGKLPDNQFVVTLIDITDRKQTEELLLIKDHAIRSSINAIAIMDLDFTISYVNQSLTKMLEYYHDKEFIGKNLSSFMLIKPAFEEIRDTLPQAGSWFGEVVLLKYNKTPFYVLMWANLVKDETGKPICVMISFIDITDKKQMEMAKRKALEQIEQNIEQFAILGDHIRNPLAVIVGLSSLAPGDITDKIILQAREIDRIITQLDMGWIESEKVRDFIKRYYMVGTQEVVSKNGQADNKKEKSWFGPRDLRK
jgi:PAS domain S-box-containing protein